MKTKNGEKKFWGTKVKVNSPGRPLRFFYLLLQFLTDLDNSFCILFTIGWTSFLLLKILNFFPKTKWRPLDFEICKKKIANFQAVPLWSEIEIENSEQQKASPSDCEENAKRIIKIG